MMATLIITIKKIFKIINKMMDIRIISKMVMTIIMINSDPTRIIMQIMKIITMKDQIIISSSIKINTTQF